MYVSKSTGGKDAMSKMVKAMIEIVCPNNSRLNHFNIARLSSCVMSALKKDCDAGWIVAFQIYVTMTGKLMGSPSEVVSMLIQLTEEALDACRVRPGGLSTLLHDVYDRHVYERVLKLDIHGVVYHTDACRSLLHFAAQYDHPDLVEGLLTKEFTRGGRNDYFDCLVVEAMSIAIKNFQPSVLRTVLRFCASSDSHGRPGRTVDPRLTKTFTTLDGTCLIADGNTYIPVIGKGKVTVSFGKAREVLKLLLTEPVEGVEPRHMRPVGMTNEFVSMLVYVARTSAFIRDRTALEMALDILRKTDKMRTGAVSPRTILADLFVSDMAFPCRYDGTYLDTQVISRCLGFFPISYGRAIQSLRDAGMSWNEEDQIMAFKMCYKIIRSTRQRNPVKKHRGRSLYGAISYICCNMDEKLREHVFDPTSEIGNEVVTLFNMCDDPHISRMIDSCFNILSKASRLKPTVVSSVEDVNRKIYHFIEHAYSPGQKGMQRAKRNWHRLQNESTSD